MVGGGLPGCTIYQYSWDIRERWPDLKYLPRPEPPRKTVDHQYWAKEYPHWQNLKCKRQKGAYFCRRHGMWITCQELDADLAHSQRVEEKDFPAHRCPQSHYDWEDTQEAFRQRQRDEFDALSEAQTEANDGGPEEFPDDMTVVTESRFEQLSLGAGSYEEPPSQQPFYGSSNPYPGYPSEAGTRDLYGSTEKNPGPELAKSSRHSRKSSSSKSSSSKGSKSHGSSTSSSSKTPSSKSSRRTYYSPTSTSTFGVVEGYEEDEIDPFYPTTQNPSQAYGTGY